MSQIYYGPGSAQEDLVETICTKSVKRKYPRWYEDLSNGKRAWWTHGCDPNATVYTESGTPCNCQVIGHDPFGNPIEACAPVTRSANSLDYLSGGGTMHYFVGYGTNPPDAYIHVSF